jgi:hypothetical protein
MRRLALAAVAAMAASGALAPAAMGDGGPPISTSVDGVPTPSGKALFETVSSGPTTTVLRLLRRSDRIVMHRTLPLNDFGIPAIGLYRPTPAGLSADGRRLVLQRTNVFYRQRSGSSFAVVDTRNLRLRRMVRLDGAFGFDGLSPAGDRIYLVEYPSPFRDPSHYVVRAYDLRADRLVPKPIVDPADDEQMRGLPVMRATSPDGRWAYTLYTGPPSGNMPFIHALDLGAGRAKCIDLPHSLGAVYNDRLRITPGGRTLTVVSKHGEELATVDTQTFDVSRSAAPSTASEHGAGSGSAFPWVILALGAGLAIATASLWGMPRLRRRRLAGADE